MLRSVLLRKMGLPHCTLLPSMGILTWRRSFSRKTTLWMREERFVLCTQALSAICRFSTYLYLYLLYSRAGQLHRLRALVQVPAILTPYRFRKYTFSLGPIGYSLIATFKISDYRLPSHSIGAVHNRESPFPQFNPHSWSLSRLVARCIHLPIH